MPKAEHRLERRARLMGEGLKRNIAMIRAQVAPEGERPPFHVQKSKDEALAWWRAHRHDELGAAALQTWKPDEIVDLDRRLSERIEQERSGGTLP